jgi:hypothetical protein
VSGEFKVKLGDRIMNAPAQSVMFVPRGTAHAFQNVGTGPGVILVGVTPGGAEKMFEERQGADAETLRTLAKKYNMEVVGRRYSKSPFGGPKARARSSRTAHPPPMHRYGIILLFNGGSSGVLGSPRRGVCFGSGNDQDRSGSVDDRFIQPDRQTSYGRRAALPAGAWLHDGRQED